jgi:hypothetical protein
MKIKIRSDANESGFETIDAEVVSGIEGTFAVHPRFIPAAADADPGSDASRECDHDTGEQWAITHVRSGYGTVLNLPSKEIACNVALQLYTFAPDLWAENDAAVITKNTPPAIKMWINGLRKMAEAGLCSCTFYWMARTIFEVAEFEKIHDSLPENDDDGDE